MFIGEFTARRLRDKGSVQAFVAESPVGGGDEAVSIFG